MIHPPAEFATCPRYVRDVEVFVDDDRVVRLVCSQCGEIGRHPPNLGGNYIGDFIMDAARHAHRQRATHAA